MLTLLDLPEGTGVEPYALALSQRVVWNGFDGCTCAGRTIIVRAYSSMSMRRWRVAAVAGGR